MDYDNDGRARSLRAPSSAPTTTSTETSGAETVFSDGHPRPAGHHRGSGGNQAWGDYDDDGDMDLYFKRRTARACLLIRNDGGGVFTDVTAAPLRMCWRRAGPLLGRLRQRRRAGPLPHLRRRRTSCPKDRQASSFSRRRPRLGDGAGTAGAGWGDYDNDGDLDLYVANYGTAEPAVPQRRRRLLRTRPPALLATRARHGVAWADYDNDGDLDLYVANTNRANKLFRNIINNGNDWLHVRLQPTVSNGSAIGARVTVWSPTLGMQIREIGDMAAGTSARTISWWSSVWAPTRTWTRCGCAGRTAGGRTPRRWRPTRSSRS